MKLLYHEVVIRCADCKKKSQWQSDVRPSAKAKNYRCVLCGCIDTQIIEIHKVLEAYKRKTTFPTDK